MSNPTEFVNHKLDDDQVLDNLLVAQPQPVLKSASSVIASDSLAGGVEIPALSATDFPLDGAKRLSVIANTGGAGTTASLGAGQSGQDKSVVCLVHGGQDVAMTGSLAGLTSITFTGDNQSVTLMWAAGAWHLLANNGATLA